MKTKLLTAFLVLGLVQLALPAWQILRYERTLAEGKVFKFRTQPVDPYDAFRGRYVRLGFDARTAKWSGAEVPKSETDLYATVITEADGFAKLDTASLTPPESGDYLIVKAGWSSDGNKTISVTLPFEQFFMNQHLAPKAETAYRANQNRSDKPSYAQVRILHGVGVIENVFVDGRPLADVARETK